MTRSGVTLCSWNSPGVQQGELNMHIIFESVLMFFTKKLSKLVHAWRNYSLPYLAHFWDTVYAAKNITKYKNQQ